MNKNILMSSFEPEMTMKLLNYNRTFRKAYICSPLKAPTVNEFFKNIELARCYVNYATEHMCEYGKHLTEYCLLFSEIILPQSERLRLSLG